MISIDKFLTHVNHADYWQSGNVDHVDYWQSGGGIILDMIYLKDGTLLVISDDAVGLYTSEQDFMDAIGDSRIIERFTGKELDT